VIRGFKSKGKNHKSRESHEILPDEKGAETAAKRQPTMVARRPESESGQGGVSDCLIGGASELAGGIHFGLCSGPQWAPSM
jgi:hypothetical protein